MARVVDLNADLGERDTLTEIDHGVVASVTSVSIACGFHAGSPTVMRELAAECRARGVVVGAHVSYRDRAGFGRRALEVAPGTLVADIEEQCAALAEAAAAAGAGVAYVKPHGALYTTMADDEAVAAAVVAAVARQPHRTLVAQGGTPVVRRCEEAGVRCVREGFCDRGYRTDGRLAPRGTDGAWIGDPEEAAARARSLVLDGGLPTVDGRWTAVAADTICVHGDTDDADRRARAVRAALETAGVRVLPFATESGRPPSG